MKIKVLLLLFFLHISSLVYAENNISGSGTTSSVIEMRETDFNKEFNEYKGLILEENKQYRENIESSY
jgi:hypothetical protein